MEKVMRDKLCHVLAEYERLAAAMATQEVACDPDSYRKHAQAHKGIEDLARCFSRWQEQKASLAEAEEILRDEKDADMREL